MIHIVKIKMKYMKKVLFFTAAMVLLSPVIIGSKGIEFSRPWRVTVLHLPKDTKRPITLTYKGQEDIWLSLDSVDFAGNDYVSNTDCAIARAFKRQLHVGYCLVGPWSVEDINGDYWNSKRYTIIDDFGVWDFLKDRELSKTICHSIQYIHLRRI
jgi:hypothetical protein